MTGCLIGIILGVLFGTKVTIKAAGTKGILGGLIGTAGGFGVGILLSGLMDRQWALLTDGSTSCALLGGTLGIIAGTVLGCRIAVRGRHTKSER
jgi:hypothetical protein